MVLFNPHLRATNAASPARPFGNGALALGGMLALASAMGIGRFAYTPILPTMADALALTKFDAGLIASANFVGYLAGALLTARTRLRGGRRAWFFGALVAGAVSAAGMGLVGSITAFLLLRFLGGVASAFVLVLGSALVIDRLAERRNRLAAVHFAGVGVGIAVSAALVDTLQAVGAGWRVLWLACGAGAGIVIPLVAWLVPDAEPERPASPAVPSRSTDKVPGLGRLSLCHGLFGFGYVVTATFLVAAVRIAPNAKSLEPAVWVIVGLAAIPSTAIWGWIGARRGALGAYGLACLVEAFGVAAGGLWTSSAGALFASVLLGGTFMGITALGFAAARALSPERQRRSFALITASFGLGQMAAPPIAGWLIDRTHSFVLPSLIAAAALMAAAIIAVQRSRTVPPLACSHPE